ncbi:MAG: hypothetical protein KJO21_02185 [Verrucomicrobiae bacterium]|nr:hypothetical protein [Verrucomicrobiae bacterium]NNJ44108.1 hypothetical protein [Akkermansiaceae bacterium]
MTNLEMLAIISLIACAILMVWQILYQFSRSRISLKHDLEILKLLPPTSVYSSKVRKRVENRLKKNYCDKESRSWGGLIFALLIFASFAFATYFNFTGGRLLIGCITAVFCMLSLLSAMCHFSPHEN